jgi:hypothetical protein
MDGGSLSSVNLFTPEFVQIAIPVAIIVIVLSIIEFIFKALKRTWTIPVCAVTVTSNIVSMILIIFMVTRGSILNPEFMEVITSFVERQNGFIWLGNGISLAIFILIVLADGLITSGIAIYKTIRNHLHKEGLGEQ